MVKCKSIELSSGYPHRVISLWDIGGIGIGLYLQMLTLLGYFELQNVEVVFSRLHIFSEKKRSKHKLTYTQIFPVIAMWGHLCGLHITATTAI